MKYVIVLPDGAADEALARARPAARRWRPPASRTWTGSPKHGRARAHRHHPRRLHARHRRGHALGAGLRPARLLLGARADRGGGQGARRAARPADLPLQLRHHPRRAHEGQHRRPHPAGRGRRADRRPRRRAGGRRAASSTPASPTATSCCSPMPPTCSFAAPRRTTSSTSRWRRTSREGAGAERIARIMERARALLADHAVNRARRAQGRSPVTDIWLWGQGRPVRFEPFADALRAAGRGHHRRGHPARHRAADGHGDHRGAGRDRLHRHRLRGQGRGGRAGARRVRPGRRPRRGRRRVGAHGRRRREGEGARAHRRAGRRPAAAQAAGRRRVAHARGRGPPDLVRDQGALGRARRCSPSRARGSRPWRRCRSRRRRPPRRLLDPRRATGSWTTFLRR